MSETVTGVNDSAKNSKFFFNQKIQTNHALNYIRRGNCTRTFKLKEKKNSQMPFKLLSHAFIAECIGISERAVAATASAALQDSSVITEVGKNHYIRQDKT